jgi:hypothetical protein
VGAAHGKMKIEKRKTKRPEGLTSLSHGCSPWKNEKRKEKN